jgi:hypothetical protein
MAKRIPGYSAHYPWWAYDHFLDLRSYRWTTPPGTRLVRLELAVPREQVLLSTYGSWHCILGRRYLPASLDSDDYVTAAHAWEIEATRNGVNVNGVQPLAEPWETQLRASWERIFDVDKLRARDTIQATFELLKLGDVVKVTEFTSLSHWRQLD